MPARLPRSRVQGTAYSAVSPPTERTEYPPCHWPRGTACSERRGHPRCQHDCLDPEFKELLTLLFPHLQNALSIRRAIGHAEERALNAEAILDASTTASILLDGDARIVHMNHPAQQHALDEDGFRVDIDRVVPTERSKKAEFRALITACAAAGLGHPGGALALRSISAPSRAAPRAPSALF